MRIAVIGATGMLGRPVCRRLAEAGHELTAIARQAPPEPLPEARFRHADVFDPVAAVRAIADHDVVYVSVNPGTTQRPGTPNAEVAALRLAIDAVRRGASGRAAYLGSTLEALCQADWWVMADKRRLAEELRTSGVAYTHFRPSNFMENLPHRFRRGNSLTLIGPSRRRWRWIAARDYADVVARALAAPEGDADEIYVQGQENLTSREAAERFAGAYGLDKLKVAQAPKPILRLVALFQPKLAYAIRITEAIESADEPFLAQREWQRFGRPQIRVENFAAKRLWE